MTDTTKPAAVAAAAGQTAAADDNAEITIIADQKPYVVIAEDAKTKAQAQKRVARLVVGGISFEHWVKSIRVASFKAGDVDDYPADLRYEFMRRQLRAYDADGVEIRLQDAALRQMPRCYAEPVLDAINRSRTSAANVLTRGDGVDTPFLMRLGKPIPFGGSNPGYVSEIEIAADTMDEIVHVRCATGEADQAWALLRVAKDPSTGMKLPTSVISRIDVEDGLFVMREILPAFLPSPDASSTPSNS
jgi:hypothetical protein